MTEHGRLCQQFKYFSVLWYAISSLQRSRHYSSIVIRCRQPFLESISKRFFAEAPPFTYTVARVSLRFRRTPPLKQTSHNAL